MRTKLGNSCRKLIKLQEEEKKRELEPQNNQEKNVKIKSLANLFEGKIGVQLKNLSKLEKGKIKIIYPKIKNL